MVDGDEERWKIGHGDGAIFLEGDWIPDACVKILGKVIDFFAGGFFPASFPGGDSRVLDRSSGWRFFVVEVVAAGTCCD